MEQITIDSHAHLYDCYDVARWCDAAIRALGSYGAVVVVDREGQDSLARLKVEVPRFAQWRSIAGGGEVVTHSGARLLVIQGVQYVAKERIEVLGLGVTRSCSDGVPAAELVKAIREAGGVPCLPWSPGKWLGARGAVVRQLLDTHSPAELVVGDIAIRSWGGPISTMLAYAKRRGFRVLCGTDPLPRSEDQELVGSFGMVVRGDAPTEPEARIRWLLAQIATSPQCISTGKRNNPVQAAVRFLSSVR